MTNPKKILLIFTLLLMILPFVVLAQASGQPSFGTTSDPGDKGLICKVAGGEKLHECVQRIYNFAIAISGIIAMGVLVAAGYLYMTAGGDGEQTTQAKEMIAAVLSGIIILATAFIILKFLNPTLVELNEVRPLYRAPQTVSLETRITSPTVGLTPEEGGTVTGNSITFQAQIVSTGASLTSVRYEVSGPSGYSSVCEVPSTGLQSPYTCILDITGRPNGNYSVRLVARNNAGVTYGNSSPDYFKVQR